MDFISPLVIGLLGSLHCLGMCGPIAVALPLRESSWATRVVSGLLYNAGRTVTYGIMGLLFGLLGLGLHIWGIQQWVSLGMGTLMILSVAFPVLFSENRFSGWYDRFFGKIKGLFGRFFGQRTYYSVSMIGLLNGLLPCGLVYIALAGALMTKTPVEGAFYMILFGLGTIPALLALSLLGNAFGSILRKRMQGVIPFLILLIGVLFVLRGMNLGIPFISPKMEPPAKQKTEEFQKPKCCHDEP